MNHRPGTNTDSKAAAETALRSAAEPPDSGAGSRSEVGVLRPNQRVSDPAHKDGPPLPHQGMEAAPVSDETARGQDRAGRQPTAEHAPRMVFDVRHADGSEAEQLRIEQIQVIREVVEWVAQTRSERGQEHAA